MKRVPSLNNLLQRTGGWYIIIIIAIAQLSAFIGGAVGTISIYLYAELDPEILAETSRLAALFFLTGNLILLTVAWYLTPNARKRLTAWSTNLLKVNPEEELSAWKEITSLTWRYGTAALIIAYMVGILPTPLLSYQQGVTTSDQLIYSLLGGMVSVLATVIFAVLIIDRLLIPTRLVLIPKNFGAQLNGLAGPS
jgi:hypothetical protein